MSPVRTGVNAVSQPAPVSHLCLRPDKIEGTSFLSPKYLVAGGDVEFAVVLPSPYEPHRLNLSPPADVTSTHRTCDETPIYTLTHHTSEPSPNQAAQGFVSSQCHINWRSDTGA